MARTKPPLQPNPKPTPTPLSPPSPGTKPFIRPPPSAVTYHIPTSPPSAQSPISTTTIHLPPYSTWTSGTHFHTNHTEYLHLLRGSIFITLNGITTYYSANEGGIVRPWSNIPVSIVPELIIKVPRYARHNWGRADTHVRDVGTGRISCVSARFPDDWNEDVIVEEWTEPGGIGKALFFWNLNGTIAAKEGDERLGGMKGLVKRLLGGEWWIGFQLLVIFWELDNWPVLWEVPPHSRGVYGLWGAEWMIGVLEYLSASVVMFAAKVLGWMIGVRAVEQKRTPEKLWLEYNKYF